MGSHQSSKSKTIARVLTLDRSSVYHDLAQITEMSLLWFVERRNNIGSHADCIVLLVCEVTLARRFVSASVGMPSSLDEGPSSCVRSRMLSVIWSSVHGVKNKTTQV